MIKNMYRLFAALVLAGMLLPSSSAAAAGKRIVFIGDSITDGNWGCPYNFKPTSAERSHTDMNHIYGHSYVMLIASDWQSRHPGSGYSFFNRGFSGHKLADLEGRWKEDVLDLRPDVLSVLVGVNDMHSYFSSKNMEPFDFDGWKERYRNLLLQVKELNPSVILILCTPFLAREGNTGKSPDYEERAEMTISTAR